MDFNKYIQMHISPGPWLLLFLQEVQSVQIGNGIGPGNPVLICYVWERNHNIGQF